MSISLLLTALGMGLLGGPHCVAMCAAPCLGVCRASTEQQTAVQLAQFQLGRMLGYAVLGAVAAASMAGIGWMSTQTAVFRPVWSMVHVAAAVLGAYLLIAGHQPRWVDSQGRRVWQWMTQATGRSRFTRGRLPLIVGMLWAGMPCGLLYSALLVAALAGSVWGGAGLMLVFAAGTAVSMQTLPWLWLRMQRSTTPVATHTIAFDGATATSSARSGAWGVRVAGVLLLGSSLWALWMGLVHAQAPWCVA